MIINHSRADEVIVWVFRFNLRCNLKLFGGFYILSNSLCFIWAPNVTITLTLTSTAVVKDNAVKQRLSMTAVTLVYVLDVEGSRSLGTERDKIFLSLLADGFSLKRVIFDSRQILREFGRNMFCFLSRISVLIFRGTFVIYIIGFARRRIGFESWLGLRFFI